MTILINKISQVLMLSMFVANVMAQTNQMDSASIAAAKELVLIQNATDAYDNMQFDMIAITTDSTIADTTVANYYMQGDFYKAVIDSVIQIQNQFMHLEIHQAGKIFIVSKPNPFNKQFLKGNIEEGLFLQMNVESISITSDGTNKILHFNFLPESDFDTYTITYDPVTYRVIESFIKTKVADDNGIFQTGVFSTIKVRFENFQPLVSALIFDTNQYVYSLGGSQFQKQVAYNDYELINLFEQQ